MSKKVELEKRYSKWGYIFVIPFVVLFLLFHFLPMANTIYYAFCDLKNQVGNYDPKFLPSIGEPWYRNFAEVFKAVSFRDAFKNTLFFWLAEMIPEWIIAFWLAAVMTDRRLKIKGRKIFRSAFIFPKIVAGSGAGNVLLNHMIMFVGTGVGFVLMASMMNGFGITEKDVEFFTSMPFFIIVVSIFVHFGIVFIYAVAGITGIPVEIFETAENCKTTVEENAGSEKNTTGLVLNNAINGSSTGGGGTGDPDDPIDPDDPVDPHPTDPGVNIDCTYYYDFPSSGSTAASFGGENGSGTFFTADKGLSASGKTGTVTVNGKTYTFEGVGGFANNGTIKFTAEKNGTLNIVSCSGSTTQRKLVVTNSAGKEVGTILSGTSSQDSAAALALEAGSYTVTNKGGGEAKLYYIGYKNDGETPQNDEMIGDADLDNMITASDALMVLQYTLAPMTTDANFVKRCDVDKDNFITATDASIILQATLTEKLVLQ